MKTSYYDTRSVELCENRHLTVDEIFHEIKDEFPDAGKSSIYRNIENLVRDGALKKVVGVGSKAYFEKAKTPHIHLIDKDTGEIMDMEI